MQIDDKWSMREERGFTWWGHELAQRVWADEARNDGGTFVARVSAETDFLYDVPNDPKLVEKIGLLNTLATLSSYVYDADSGCITARCSAYVHEENSEWLSSLLSAAVAIQAADAHIKTPMAELLGGRPAFSAHPQSGQRPDADDMLDVIEVLFAPKGRQASAFGEQDVQLAEETLQKLGAVTSSSGSGLTAEVAFFDDKPAALGGQGTALLQVFNDVKNPQMGSGALFALRLPITLAERDAALLAQRLNSVETSEEFTRCHFLGSWSVKDGTPTFVTFLPTALYGYGIVTNMAMSMAARSRFFATYLKDVRYPSADIADS
ncbi:MAG: hypothetical protein ACYC9X_11225 [Dehalococcoidia bacterium]